MWQLFGCTLIDRYVTPAALSLLEPRPFAEFSCKMGKFFEDPKLIFLWLLPFCVVIISLTHMLPA